MDMDVQVLTGSTLNYANSAGLIPNQVTQVMQGTQPGYVNEAESHAWESSSSLSRLTSGIKLLQIQPDSLQVSQKGSSLSFSSEHNLGSIGANSDGTLDLQGKKLTVSISLASGQQTLSFNVKMDDITQSAFTQQPYLGDKELEKLAQKIMQEIQREIQRNPDADMTQVALNVITKNLQPLQTVLRYMMNFLSMLGHKSSSLPSGAVLDFSGGANASIQITTVSGPASNGALGGQAATPAVLNL